MLNLGNKNNNSEQILKTMNMLGLGSVIEGNIKTEGDIRIDGKVIGNVQVNSKLAIGETGLIEGNVICKNASIEGRVKGNLQISEFPDRRFGLLRRGDQAIFGITINKNINASTWGCPWRNIAAWQQNFPMRPPVQVKPGLSGANDRK